MLIGALLSTSVPRAFADTDNAKPVAPKAQDARFVPLMQDGKQIGLKAFAIREGSRYARAGLVMGDVIESINGTPATTPDSAASMAREASLELRVRRDGKTVALTVPAR